jgi:hypothetical protein
MAITPPTLDTRVLDAVCENAFSTLTDTDTQLLFSQFAAVPAVVDEAHLSALKRLAQLLDAALRAIVERYFDDSRIRAIYRLPESLERILQFTRRHPYNVGLYRPDFIYDKAGQPRICEIGARYPLNGWFLSRLATEAYGQAAERLCLRTQTEQVSFLSDLLNLHSPASTVAMVHERESGTEIFHLREALRRQGTEFVQVAPGRLGTMGGRLSVDGRLIDRAILDLDRSELPLITDDALVALIDSEAYFNDVRTLILVHDKRVLAVLCNEAIMRDCLPAADLAELRPYLIPSWAPASAEEAEIVLSQPENLIAKRSSGGRGLGTVVRDDSDLALWKTLVRDHWADYMFQPYLQQREFLSPDHESDQSSIHLVGMHLCWTASSYGLGVFRGSDQAVINLHQDRGRLYPAFVQI